MKKNTRKQQKMIHFTRIYSCILEKIKEKCKNQQKLKEKHKIKENQGFPANTSKILENPRKYINNQFTISTTPAPGRPYFRAVAAV